jgi:hypothetical protein
MNETISASERLRTALAAEDVHSGLELADFTEAPAAIFFVAKRTGAMPYAELRYFDDKNGKELRLNFFPLPTARSMGEKRRSALEQAQEAAKDLLGIEGWSRTPYSNSWLPSVIVSKLHEEFDAEAPEGA